MNVEILEDITITDYKCIVCGNRGNIDQFALKFRMTEHDGGRGICKACERKVSFPGEETVNLEIHVKFGEKDFLHVYDNEEIDAENDTILSIVDRLIPRYERGNKRVNRSEPIVVSCYLGLYTSSRARISPDIHIKDIPILKDEKCSDARWRKPAYRLVEVTLSTIDVCPHCGKTI